MKDAIVAGTVALDLVADSVSAGRARAGVGNTGANIAVRLATAGWNVEFVSLVGNDTIADLVEADLNRWGVKTAGLVRQQGYLTPRVFQVVSASTASSASLLLRCPRCDRPRGHRLALPSIDDLPKSILEFAAGAELTIADIAGPTANRLVSLSGGSTWYEASLREATRSEIDELASAVQTVKCSEEELDYFENAFEGTNPSQKLQIVTQGSRGVRFRGLGVTTWETLSSFLHQPPIDTIGAGDAFTAAAASIVAAGGSARAAAEAGSQAAAKACMSVGARGDMVLSNGSPSAWLPDEIAFQCGHCDAGD